MVTEGTKRRYLDYLNEKTIAISQKLAFCRWLYRGLRMRTSHAPAAPSNRRIRVPSFHFPNATSYIWTLCRRSSAPLETSESAGKAFLAANSRSGGGGRGSLCSPHLAIARAPSPLGTIESVLRVPSPTSRSSFSGATTVHTE